MSKPATPAVWATDANYTIGPTPGEPTKVTPSSTKIAQGFEPEEKPAPENLNQRLNLIGQWTEYLDSGQLEGDITIDGDLDVTGDVTIGGTLDVTGLITAEAGLTAGPNQHVKVSGTGKYQRGSRTRPIAPAEGLLRQGTANIGDDYITLTNAASVWLIPISGLEDGERLTSVSIRISPVNAGDDVQFQLWRSDNSGGALSQTQLGSTQHVTGTTAWTTATVSGLTEDIGSAHKHIYALVSLAAFVSGCDIGTTIYITTVP